LPVRVHNILLRSKHENCGMQDPCHACETKDACGILVGTPCSKIRIVDGYVDGSVKERKVLNMECDNEKHSTSMRELPMLSSRHAFEPVPAARGCPP
jgi:hypothetical protein